MCDGIPEAGPHIQAGTLKAYALGTAERNPAIPNVPTSKGAGLPEFRASPWFALFAPKGTLQAVRDQLSDSIDKALDAPSVRKRLLGIGGDIPPKAARGPQSLTALVQKKLPGGDRSSRRRTLRASAHPHPHKSRSTKRRRWHFEAERLRSLEVDPRSSASSETLKNFFSAVS